MFASTRQVHVCCGERVLQLSLSLSREPELTQRGFEVREVPVSKAAFVSNNQDGGENARDECTAPHLVVGDGDELEVALLGPAADDLGERVRQPHLRFFGTKKSNRQQRSNVDPGPSKRMDTCKRAHEVCTSTRNRLRSLRLHRHICATWPYERESRETNLKRRGSPHVPTDAPL